MSDRIARQLRWARERLRDVNLQVRPYRSQDRSVIEALVRSTALRGRPASDFFEDDDLVVRLFVEYYLDREPDACVVAEIDGRLCGYALCCTDTRRYVRFVLRMAPALLLRVLIQVLGLRYRHRQTYRTIWWLISRSWRELPAVDLSKYPAHVHIGIDISALGEDAGLAWWPMWTRVLEAAERELVQRGCRGVHGHVSEPTTQRAITRRILGIGWRVLEARNFSLFSLVTGEPWMVRAVAKDLS